MENERTNNSKESQILVPEEQEEESFRKQLFSYCSLECFMKNSKTNAFRLKKAKKECEKAKRKADAPMIYSIHVLKTLVYSLGVLLVVQEFQN